ncbi:MAG: UDP-glucose 4-epimerase GalE [Phycisphaeraceae bacterium]|nr:UDP-glucose 4-epimerase GalE [Phycisphaeraceae bacterium]
MNVLVTGGAGYIGSHCVKQLKENGDHVVVLDNLYRGHIQAVPNNVQLEQIDLRDTDAVTKVLEKHNIQAIYHFAALAYVGESVGDPLMYYDNNTAGTISLLMAMKQVGVNRLVFSSTCATYGQPESMPIVETMPQDPINPYGRSKLLVEYILKDYATSNPKFAFTALRYFNVAGSAADGSIGEDHEPETHIIPVILNTVLGINDKVTVFGTDYPTEDGTCVRDYIHVEDLIAAHMLCMSKLEDGQQNFFNLGIGNGYSVKQVIDACKRVTGADIPVEYGPRRAGDPAQLYSNASKLRNATGWEPQYTDIDKIVATAWKWYKNHPGGYSEK